jgi:hypothetical protein
MLPDTVILAASGAASPWNRRGCAMDIADTTGKTSLSIASLEGWFRDHGWREALRFSADGPDGTRLGFFQGGQICVIEGQWDGLDDSDSSYVPKPGMTVRIRCVALAARDTAP